MISSDKIIMMEDHDKAYHAWRDRGIRGKILVHIDAHIDFGWIPEVDLDEIGPATGEPGGRSERMPLLNPFISTRKKMLHIGNYICPAMRDGMVEKFYWVVPDESLRSRRGRAQIIKYLRRVLKVEGSSNRNITRTDDGMRCRIMGKDVIVCSLESLEFIDEPVLLDIDVDFMVTRYIYDDLNPKRVPWMYPDELVKKISKSVTQVELLTIAYSVEGGYTPLRFKYLGDDLRAIYAGEISESARAIIEIKKKALLCEKVKNIESAVALYKEALRIDDGDASVYFNLFVLRQDAFFYRQACARDKTYATDYNNYGILYLQYNKFDIAEAEYKKFLLMDADNAAILNGLGYIALAKKRYLNAAGYFNRCLSLKKDHLDARRGIGIVNFKTGSLDEAQRQFSDIAKDSPDDQETYWWLGRIAERRGEKSIAIDNYKNGVMRGGEGPLVHLLLARLYLSKGFYLRAIEESKRFFQMTGSALLQ